MKNVILALFIMGMTAVSAQDGRGKHQREAMRNLSPEQIATLQTKKMVLALDLDNGQEKEVYALQLEQAKTRKAKMEERKERRENGEGKPSSEERYNRNIERLDAQIAYKNEIKKILSDNQYTKWEEMAMERAKKAKKELREGRNSRR